MFMDNEWPSLTDVPGEDSLTSARPKGQALTRYIWWNGELREAERQHVHYYANALHYGTSVFEGIRCYPAEGGPALFRLRDHIERLIFASRIYGMQHPFDVETLEAVRFTPSSRSESSAPSSAKARSATACV